MTAAGWYADPEDPQQMRYWDGSAWTDHRSPAHPQTAPAAPQQWAATPPPGRTPARPVQQGGDPSVASPKMVSKRIGDPREPTLWEGTSKNVGATSRYRVTKTHIYYETGLLTTNSQQVPLLQVRDVDVRASVTQKARGIGDVVVHVNTQPQPVVLNSLEDPKRVRDIINQAAGDARAALQRQQTTQYHHGAVAPAPQAVAATAGPPAAGMSVVEQLKELAALRDAGVLTEEEFIAQKTKILG